MIGQSGEAAVVLFPNPARDRVRIELKGMEGEFQAELLDLRGRSLLKIRLAPSGNALQSAEMVLSELPSGLFLLRVSGENRQWFQKLLIRH